MKALQFLQMSYLAMYVLSTTVFLRMGQSVTELMLASSVRLDALFTSTIFRFKYFQSVEMGSTELEAWKDSI
jgi:hypothetical protein